MYILKYLFLLLLVVRSQSRTFDEFFEYINKTIAASATWINPTDNGELCETKNSSVKYYGHFDFIIVGGGSAGSVLTGRLSEVKKWRILLIEAGHNQTEFSDVPAFSGYLASSDMNWCYNTAPQTTACKGMKNNSCPYPRGKALGGSSTINGVIHSRGIPADLDKWAKMGNIGWAYKDVLKYFKKSEKNDIPNLDPFYHGTNGPIHVNNTYPPSVFADTFLQANLETGLEEIDYNGKHIQGVSRIQYGIKGNKRDNSAHGYVDPVQRLRNVYISLNSFVTKILIENTKAHGVEFIKNGQKYNAFANKEVILSAGAINSPQILMLSGVGPAEELSSLGIPVKNNLPAVGKNMEDHPMFVNFYFRTKLTDPNLSIYKNLKRYEAGLTPFTNGAGLEQLAFINTKNNSKHLRDIEFITFSPPFGVPENPEVVYNFKDKFAAAFKEYNHLTDLSVVIVLLKPKSRGSVTLKSNNPRDFPIIDVNYFSDPNNEDIETMYQGIKYLLSLPATKAFKKVNAVHIGIQPQCEHLRHINDRYYWYCAIRHMSTTVFHPVGTTRMGSSIHNSVVDPDLKVHNMKNLRVVDAGIMPEIISGHPSVNVYMIAEKASDNIKKIYGAS